MIKAGLTGEIIVGSLAETAEMQATTSATTGMSSAATVVLLIWAAKGQAFVPRQFAWLFPVHLLGPAL